MKLHPLSGDEETALNAGVARHPFGFMLSSESVKAGWMLHREWILERLERWRNEQGRAESWGAARDVATVLAMFDRDILERAMPADTSHGSAT